ncbi:MAG: efflux RND transporter periplasmic adaptor subunit [Xanthomonadales bacterium]|nr:efflux RND transporter periplasmic adaptor subunit [Xanthomonadales bacterium]
MNKAKILKISLPLLVLVISVVVVKTLVAAKPPPEKKEEDQRLVSLFVDEVYSEVVTISVKSQGEVSPKVEIDLIPQVSGRVVAVSAAFAEGAEFNPHTVLVKIDDTDYKLAVIRAQAQVAEAQVNVERELANAKIKTDEWARKRNASKPTAFALNKPQVLGAKARLRSAQADLRAANLSVARTAIKVPFQGHVRSKNIGIGQYVTAGMVLGRVFSTDTVEIRLPLTDSQMAELNLPMGFMADANKLAPIVQFRARVGNQDKVWQGKIVRTNAAVDQQTRIIYATAEVADPYGSGANGGAPLAVGMFVSAEIEGVHSRDALVIPRLGLRKADQVYLINDGRLEIRTVEVISTSADWVYLASGVEVGDKVVTSTIPSVIDGMKVIALNREPLEIEAEVEEAAEEYQAEDFLLDEPEKEDLAIENKEDQPERLEALDEMPGNS